MNGRFLSRTGTASEQTINARLTVQRNRNAATVNVYRYRNHVRCGPIMLITGSASLKYGVLSSFREQLVRV
jgi:hypothetical protein